MPQLSQAETEEIHLEIIKLMKDTKKINIETGKITSEIFWYPMAIALGLIGSISTVTAVMIKLI
ncbi:hypothetical protein N5D52_04955 [Pseudomonas sp. GD03860]|uniref:hypothetical protein n=1 Tax=Pseudomonas TaxID=286 RepID=UPI002363D745|nr:MULTISPECIES: hypothetical protein [Pseudomonas]MDD2058344.1 hypothetical protein [Pseudomonas putida]MDH0636278.1 hypothetical protein [Pseudomonas sp. GD03860]